MQTVTELLAEKMGVRPLVVAETGSHAWGTHVATSDHDYTVVGVDVRPTITTYPRSADKIKFDYAPESTVNKLTCDAQFFSIEKFLRMAQNSNLVAYEIVCGGDNVIYASAVHPVLVLMKQVVVHHFDSREMYRSCIGSLYTLKRQYENTADPVEAFKRKRQIFRYGFVALQLQLGNVPVLNVHKYFHGPHDANTSMIQRLYEWAFHEGPTVSYELAMLVMTGAYEPTARPKEKQHEKFDVTNAVFAQIFEIMGNTK